MKWNTFFIEMAILIAKKSKDLSTKVGCVIVGPDNEVRSTGFNGFPRGVKDERGRWKGYGVEDVDSRYERPAKYLWTEHAERNAIYNAARIGISLKNCKLYLNFNPQHICSDCARAIIQSGIIEVIGTTIPLIKNENIHQWEHQFQITATMFKEAHIKTTVIPEDERVDF